MYLRAKLRARRNRGLKASVSCRLSPVKALHSFVMCHWNETIAQVSLSADSVVFSVQFLCCSPNCFLSLLLSVFSSLLVLCSQPPALSTKLITTPPLYPVKADFPLTHILFPK